VEIGIRPEHLSDDSQASDPGNVYFEGTTDVVEPLGSTSLITFALNGASYTAIGDVGIPRRSGAKLRLKAAPRDIFLIDTDSGLVVLPEAPSNLVRMGI
jgi:multiple sugar transport system ATP-binding protein